jgi:hypothetical protein
MMLKLGNRSTMPCLTGVKFAVINRCPHLSQGSIHWRHAATCLGLDTLGTPVRHELSTIVPNLGPTASWVQGNGRNVERELAMQLVGKKENSCLATSVQSHAFMDWVPLFQETICIIFKPPVVSWTEGQWSRN